MTGLSDSIMQMVTEAIESNRHAIMAMGTVTYIDTATHIPYVTMDGSSVAVPVKCSSNISLTQFDRVGVAEFGSEWVVIAVTAPVYLPTNTTLISETMINTPTSLLTIDNIPPTFRDLQIVTTLKDTNTASQYYSWCMQFNGDTGANYAVQQAGLLNFAAAWTFLSGGGFSNTASGLLATSSNFSPGNVLPISFAHSEVLIPDYSNTARAKQAFSRQAAWSSSGNAATTFGSLHWAVAQAISKITFLPNGGTALAAGSIIRIYGIGARV